MNILDFLRTFMKTDSIIMIIKLQTGFTIVSTMIRHINTHNIRKALK